MLVTGRGWADGNGGFSMTTESRSGAFYSSPGHEDIGQTHVSNVSATGGTVESFATLRHGNAEFEAFSTATATAMKLRASTLAQMGTAPATPSPGAIDVTNQSSAWAFDSFHSSGMARYSEFVTSSDITAGAIGRFVLNVSGFIIKDAQAKVTLDVGGKTEQHWIFGSAGSFNEQIVSDPFVWSGDSREITVSLETSVRFDPDDGVTQDGFANFENTLVVEGIDVRDPVTGALLTNAVVNGASGSRYDIVNAVPEPSSVAFALLGLLYLARRQR